MDRFDAILYHRINEVFGYLPLAAVVGEKIFCCHGGLSPDLRDLRQVACMDRPIPEVPQEGLVCDLLWADPYMVTLLGEIKGLTVVRIYYVFAYFYDSHSMMVYSLRNRHRVRHLV